MPTDTVGCAPTVRPLRQFVMKVHSRCDLACDHCYIYEHADQSWRRRPRAMSAQVVLAAAERIREHSVRHDLDRVNVVLHGGEPLLLGHVRLAEMLLTLRKTIEPATELSLHLQTNGVRLSPQICEVLADFGVHVGVSLD